MLPDLESLRCFVQAATHASFRAAARSVALSPAAFGDRIARLEEQLGARLFERTTRRVTLTPPGERLLVQARRCLEEAERCRAVAMSPGQVPFDVVIGTRFELGMSWLVPALAALERARPTRRLHLYFGDSADLLPRVLEGRIDCMVTSARLTTPGVDVVRLHEEEYAFVGARSLLAKHPLARSDDAKHHVLLDVAADLPLFRYLLDTRPPRESWAFERVQYLGGIGPIRARALEGAGVAVLPLYYVEEDIRRGRLRRLLGGTKLPSDWFRLVWRKGAPRGEELRSLGAELSRLPLR
jgi:LysR family transcriptional regulator, glycine cleavage system transcriptional activator